MSFKPQDILFASPLIRQEALLRSTAEAWLLGSLAVGAGWLPRADLNLLLWLAALPSMRAPAGVRLAAASLADLLLTAPSVLAAEAGLEAGWSLLRPGGRLGIITFHSLEDRLVKQRFKQLAEPPQLPRRLPVRAKDAQPEGRLIGKAMRAGAKEVSQNPRARSAMFRVIEKLTEVDNG